MHDTGIETWEIELSHDDCSDCDLVAIEAITFATDTEISHLVWFSMTPENSNEIQPTKLHKAIVRRS